MQGAESHDRRKTARQQRPAHLFDRDGDGMGMAQVCEEMECVIEQDAEDHRARGEGNARNLRTDIADDAQCEQCAENPGHCNIYGYQQFAIVGDQSARMPANARNDVK
jgi:uncharacterized protein YdaU (DUF1376 family)